jgi:hypothetical protein
VHHAAAIWLPPRATERANRRTFAQNDEKNIRRRVYDALNVLMAMGIIRKQKKTILWVGLPQNGSPASQADQVDEICSLRRERDALRSIVTEKVQQRVELQAQER